MPRKAIDMTGQVIGRLTVLSRSDKTNSHREVYWLCQCECGNQTVVNGAHLRKENGTRSCGCLALGLQIHSHPLYAVWNGMINRCCNPNAHNYQYYGGRGISVAPEWRYDLFAFVDVVGERPEGTSLDRIDVDGNYEPGNVRWATAAEQRVNRRERTHCHRGHEYTEENTQWSVVHSRGGKLQRGCKECKREQRETRKD